ncbi:hypothetical protein [Vibrio sp. 10N]|uniref:hypothetical protein n=1 Tax=Vibrio sp. 10N TaxID=3058938 RepID=UPI002812CDB7|nr:hypothetical protein VB10N_10940 [Vibrio sp. 10N]
MMDGLYVVPAQEDVARNWLIDTPEALNDSNEQGEFCPPYMHAQGCNPRGETVAVYRD